ncbi:hypothetical protein BCL76_110168 [Streptomyces sp. CG 926]|uniref:hypothetical protein n=1 Tax=Streptomyces sp. CG 926 TaxID=1882405 RepID=UPI000D6BDA30|nr:hypothetical protein [Streptomyces sp. CG 926]PWK66682.1 hypothetical protein BCL76_110168 [Streptomyces sp. CG 926]
MSETEPPLLADVYPALVSFLDAALVAEGEPALAQALVRLRFHGWCGCRMTCTYLRTAPAAQADNLWIHLDDEEAPRVWLQLAQGHDSFAGMEICEFDLGPASALDPDRPAGVG